MVANTPAQPRHTISTHTQTYNRFWFRIIANCCRHLLVVPHDFNNVKPCVNHIWAKCVRSVAADDVDSECGRSYILFRNCFHINTMSLASNPFPHTNALVARGACCCWYSAAHSRNHRGHALRIPNMNGQTHLRAQLGALVWSLATGKKAQPHPKHTDGIHPLRAEHTHVTLVFAPHSWIV